MINNQSNIPVLNERYCIGASYLRFILLFFVCFWNYAFPEPTGILAALSGFATPCFFILSGYFVLSDDREERAKKLKRKVVRTAICFALILVLYIILNLVLGLIVDIPFALTKRVIIEFVVMNMWPLSIGSNIWFIQAMLYAYIILFFVEKLNLMRFYKVILIVSVLFMLLTGEFSGIIHFNFLGYQFIPGNWLTRAIPYILLGRLIREKKEALLSKRIWIYLITFVLGGVLVLGELFLLVRTGYLGYEGHMIGFGVMAFSISVFAISFPEGTITPITASDTALSGFTYIFMDPIYYIFGIIGMLLGGTVYKVFALFGGIVALLISLIIAFVISRLRISLRLFSSYHLNTMRAEINDIFEE